MRREYVWLDERPIALIVTTGGVATTYAVHAGQIGEPLMLTDASQAVVWDAAIDPWGRAVMLSPGGPTLDLRLMGQWLQGESGLHQNWMRDYDPTLGRYVQADPLGLEAGQNLYAYVDGDPLNAVDPTGELPFLIVPILVGASTAAIIDIAIQLAENDGDWRCIDPNRVLTSALVGGAFSGLGPTGVLLGRGGQRAVQYGFARSAGLLNRGSNRFGWGWNGSRNIIRRGGTGANKHPGDWNWTGHGGGAAPVRDGLIAGGLGAGSIAGGSWVAR